MDACRICLGKRRIKGEDDILVWIELRRYTHLNIKRFYRHHTIIRFAFLLQFFLLLGPFLQFLSLRLHTFFVRFLRKDFERISLVAEHARTIGHTVSKLYIQRILVNKRRILEPIGKRIILLRFLQNKGIFLVEIQALDLWQDRIAIAVKEREAIGFLALCLEEEAFGNQFGKGTEHYIIRQEMGIINLIYRLDMQGINPCSILSYIRLA